MVELEFHCCVCGEQNEQEFLISVNYNSDRHLTRCDYCKADLDLISETTYKIVSVDEQ